MRFESPMPAEMKALLERRLIKILGKKEEPGRPILYGTTREFLEFFNLNELRDLPTLREYHELTEDSMKEVEKLDAAGRDEAAAGDASSAETELAELPELDTAASGE